MKFVDTHAHLPMLKHGTTSEILERSRQAGVEQLVTVATEEENWESSRAIASTDPHVFYTLGLHPHSSTAWNTCAPKLEALFKEGIPKKCVGIGETGLDFHYNFADRETQLASLEAQLAFAKRFDLPVVLHCREAFADLFASIKKIGLCSRGGVMHCFTGAEPDAKAAIALGLKISFSGILTFRNADPLRAAAKALPLSELLLETDCPYLTPMPHRGKPNEPSFLPLTAVVLADTLGVALETVAEATTENALSLFQLAS